MVFHKLKRWLLLRKAKKEEQKHIPTKKELKAEHNDFMKHAKELATSIEEDNKSAPKK